MREKEEFGDENKLARETDDHLTCETSALENGLDSKLLSVNEKDSIQRMWMWKVECGMWKCGLNDH